MTPPPDLLLEPIVRLSLAEDLGRAGDLTASACVPSGTRMQAVIAARAPGVASGLNLAPLTVSLLDPDARVALLAADGDMVAAGAALVRLEGDARALLAAERTMLNLIGRLCGVATLTRRYVDAVAGTGARIADTRKTTPGLRALEKHAVRCGGGMNHRFGLDDAILIKDNHIAVCGGVAAAIRAARASAGHLVRVEVEVDTLDQFDVALGERPDVIMLDNFDLTQLREAVARAAAHPVRPVLEASGGVSLGTVRDIAATGVDVISVGALTHSAPALDIGLDVT